MSRTIFLLAGRYLLVALLICSMIACHSGDDDVPAPLPGVYEAYVETNPANFPAGGGLDFDLRDTGAVAQLDAASAFAWDLKVLAYRTANGGRPALFLYGDETAGSAVEALDVSAQAGVGLGADGFAMFTRVTEAMQQALRPDGAFDFDPESDVDAQGRPDEARLLAAYQALVIGDRVVRLEEAEQPVFLVRDREGALHKFQHVRREGGGRVLFRWSRFPESAIE